MKLGMRFGEFTHFSQSDHGKFSGSICRKVSSTFHERTVHNAQVILKDTARLGITPLERKELVIVAASGVENRAARRTRSRKS